MVPLGSCMDAYQIWMTFMHTHIRDPHIGLSHIHVHENPSVSWAVSEPAVSFCGSINRGVISLYSEERTISVKFTPIYVECCVSSLCEEISSCDVTCAMKRYSSFKPVLSHYKLLQYRQLTGKKMMFSHVILTLWI